MITRTRRGRIQGRRRAPDGGALILVLALVLAIVFGSSFQQAGGRTVPVVLWYLDASTHELVRGPSVVKLPSRQVEQVAAMIDLLRTPPTGQNLATAVPVGLTARSAVLLPGGILQAVLGTAREQRPMGFAEENALYWQLVNSLISLPDVHSVELSVEGRDVGTFLSFVKTRRELAVNEAVLDKGQPVDLYFVLGDGRYAVEVRSFPSGLTRSQMAFQVVKALVAGPVHASLASPLPDAGVLRGVTVSGHTVTVDFENSIMRVSMGAGQAEEFKECLVLTLTRLPGISRVRLTVDGQTVHEMFGYLNVWNPLYRLDGRLEAGTAVAVYSLAKVDDDRLPVLNVVLQKRALTSRNAMISEAIALLAEPPAGDVSFVPPGTRIMGMSIQDNSGMLKLSLTIKPLSADLLEEALLVQQLRLTFTEVPSVTSLQMTVNGAVSFLPGGYYIGKPFSR
ncbi:GerMN domain-containing protein [bacterium]|nr:GerMN domain-containing protein [bacterium]